MSESTLGLTYDEIRRRVGIERGYGTSIDGWNAKQADLVEIFVKQGAAKFYLESGYDWSFLRPLATLKIAISTDELLLPADFGYLIGKIYFGDSNWGPPLCLENDGQILMRRQESASATGRPMYAAFIPATNPGVTHGQRQKMIFFPTADASYTIRLRYSILPDALSPAQQYPHGGAAHAQTILEACLAESEQFDGMSGIHTSRYQEKLAGSMALDRKLKPQSLAPSGEEREEMPYYIVTYSP